ncbi:MAG: hydroxychlorobactene glucosyltransferase CruC [Balneolaceae bacterium]
MIYILYFALFYLIATSAVLIRNSYEFKALKDVEIRKEDPSPLVSICIPARNEENVIERCVTSALKQDYENFEVLVLDDASTDSTTEILSQLSGIIANLKHIKGASKPDKWLGKPWACYQLSEAAKGDILVFIDADVWLEPEVIQNTVSILKKKDALTVWPQQRLETFWENMIIPLVYFALFTLLPAKYVERPPRWMPSFFQSIFDTKFVAACGQFFAFTKSAYLHIKGHNSVKDQVVEDMELAKNLKSNGLKLQMMHGVDSVYCRMYTSHSEIWNGFKKNFLAGFGNTYEFGFMGVLHFFVFLIPVFSLGIGFLKSDSILILLSVTTIIFIIIQRAFLSFLFKWNFSFAFLHIISVVWFQILGIVSVFNKLLGIKSNWKGREV